MPKKSPISKDVLQETFLKYRTDIFEPSGRLKTASDSIWKNISSDENFVVNNKPLYKPKQCHDYVQQNRHSLYDILTQNHHIDSEEINKQIPFKDTHYEYEESTSSFSQENSDYTGHSKWKVRIPFVDFDLCKPEEVEYSEGNRIKRRRVLKSCVWAGIFSTHISDQCKIPCSLSFKKCKVRLSEMGPGPFLFAMAKCTECGEMVRIEAQEEPKSPSPLILTVTAPDTRGVFHTKKRQFRGQQRLDAGKEMLENRAWNWRRNKADAVMKFGEQEPPYLPSLTTCRKVREEAKKLDCPTPKIADPVLALVEMKMNPEYASKIHTVSYDEFFCFYWSKEQNYLYKKYISQSLFPSISVDATGSLVKKLQRNAPNPLSNHIFLYEIVIHFQNTVISVAQLLSEMQDTATILFWLNKWLKDVQKMPRECVCDFSLALLGAISRSLNDMSLANYNKCCFKILSGIECCELSCYIRVDVAHLIKTVCRWKCYPKEGKLVRKFLIRCVGLLVQCRNFLDLRNLVENIFILTLSETCGLLAINMTEESRAEKAKQYIGKRINIGAAIPDTLKEVIEDTNYIIKDHDIDAKEQSSTTEIGHCDSIQQFIKDILHEAKICALDNGIEPNPYYCPGFSEKLAWLLSYFPLWTGVMAEFFGSPNTVASSSSVEGDFALLKNGILMHEEPPLKLPNFVSKHLRALSGLTKLAAAEQALVKKTSKKPPKSCNSQVDDDSQNELMFQEQWRGRNENIHDMHFDFEGKEFLEGREDLSPPNSLNGYSLDGSDAKKKKGPVPRQQEELCLVCGDRASGYHYNALTCEGCKGFFRRSITKNAVYQCKYGNNCEIDMYMRRKCQECRLKKCLSVGMRPECVVPEYQCMVKRKEKKAQKDKDKPNSTTNGSPEMVGMKDPDLKQQLELEKSPLSNGVKPVSPEQEELIHRLVYYQNEYEQPSEDDLKRITNSPIEGENQSDIKFRHITEITILTVQLIVEFAKRLPGFDKLLREDQIALLKACSSEVMMFRMARRYDVQSDSILFANNQPYTKDSYSMAGMGETIDDMLRFCRQMYAMKVDNAEYALLTAIVIFSERPSLIEAWKVEKIQEIYLEALKAYVDNRRRPKSGAIFAKLLSVLTELRTLGNQNSEMCFSLKLKNKKLPPFLAEIWDVMP